ncbi:MAG: hypothetical protein QOG71_2332 [Pyrinomonadaceae bacterium]|nr:hypothetical protein [Pyrinomonadaceae bacterium]
MDAIDILAIILSIVSLVITVVGFFASLKFYRDGVELQNKANDALTKLSEKTDFIQTQVGGMFDKTLDAAIGKRMIVSENFEELSAQIEQTKNKLIEETVGQIGAAGEAERKRLSEIVDSQINLIQEKVDNARDSAVTTEPIPALPLSFLHYSILSSMGGRNKHRGVTFRQIVDHVKETYPEVASSFIHTIVTRYVEKGWVIQINHESEDRFMLTELYWDLYAKQKV